LDNLKIDVERKIEKSHAICDVIDGIMIPRIKGLGNVIWPVAVKG
jgi:hypothetical protein